MGRVAFLAMEQLVYLDHAFNNSRACYTYDRLFLPNLSVQRTRRKIAWHLSAIISPATRADIASSHVTGQSPAAIIKKTTRTVCSTSCEVAGIQTAISKQVAERQAVRDTKASGRFLFSGITLSVSLALLLLLLKEAFLQAECCPGVSCFFSLKVPWFAVHLSRAAVSAFLLFMENS